MNFPNNLHYSSDHEWIKIDGNTAIVGITDYAQSELGDIVFVDIPSVGENIKADDVFGTIEAVKTVSDLKLPISGKVIEFNEKLTDAPELVNQDPYNEGWIIKIELDTPSATDHLMTAEEYKKFVEK